MTSAQWTPGEAAAKDPHDRPERPWWQGAVFYQIYPRSFLDTDGDGVGDLDGVRRRLPYLAQLGVDAIWLSPFYRSPMADFGYDVADHCDVDPLFGDVDIARELVREAHEHGLRVVVDYVPNHTSDEHAWFVDARSSRTAAHRDWYVWVDGDPATPPNPWMSAFTGGPAWTWDAGTEQWYLHLFLPEQPDLDWHNRDVVDAMHDVMRFWLDLGVDGFRIDVAFLIGKDVPLGPAASKPEPSAYTHELMRGFRKLVDSYPRERVTVGEIYIMSTRAVASFYGDNDELHLNFNFPPLYAPFEAAAWRQRIDEVVDDLDPVGAWPVWVLSNHDNPRHRTRYGGSEDKARAAALVLLGVRGTPFLYQGEELGLCDAVVPPALRVDPGGRDGCRAPLPWEAGAAHGWATDDPWLPWPPDADHVHAAAQEADAASFLHLYRAAIAARRRSPALRHGAFRWLESPPGVLAWERAADGDRAVVVVNMTQAEVRFPGSYELIVASAASQGGWQGALGPWSAAWLAPR
ncbi:MAG TPA: alpha-amylase family glycosyl hydrolase [Acidimicrobiales bacterium]|nr:alpha-amylase family glycosyl hydrolase [Acidimicrobiales bacterium]